MKYQSIFVLLVVVFSFFSCHQDDTVVLPPPIQNTDTSSCDFTAPIYPNVSDNTALIDSLQNCFTPATTFTYFEARQFLYSDVDKLNGKVQCIYSGYETEINPAAGQNFIAAADALGINCEHSFPQSMGASQEPAQSDMFHIYPALADVNSARSNKPYAEINDSNTDEWFYLQQTQTSIPSSNIDAWSESDFDFFEPREDVKGDIARSIFYFKVIHEASANQSFFDGMRSTLLQWHAQDPVDNKELNRNNKVKQYQGNDNPFIIDADLAQRVFGN